MKVLIVFSALVAIAVANYGYQQHETLPAKEVYSSPHNTGHSSQYRKQDSWGNYKFGYDWKSEGDHWKVGGGASQNEEGDSWGNKHGSYSLHIDDGRVRKVSYTADAHGFRAKIDTNEPGIVAKAPADVSIKTPHGDAHGYSSHEDNHYDDKKTITHVGGYTQHGHDSYGHDSHGYQQQSHGSGWGHSSY